MITRRFLLTELECLARIGAYDHERLAPQRVLIDIELVLVAEDEPQRDQLAETLNYDVIRTTVLQIAESQHFDLQETLARRIFDALASLPEVHQLGVRTAKPDAYGDCRQIAYELSNIT
ncbi:dihydroneopterin aldolase [SAR116 cluster bacterium]|nr:dihydroneopterin aldolase [SAR116 cluster bacterium]